MIEVKRAVCRYPKSQKPAVDVSNLVFPDGEVIALLGENGAGKTTLIKAILGLIPCTQREISVDGRQTHESFHDLVFVTEEGSIFEFMTPAQTGDFLCQFYPKFDREMYDGFIEFFELEDKKIGNMSRGQQAKAELAAGFAKGAKNMLMDEPFLGKDVFTRRDFIKLMSGELKIGRTIVVSTHQIDEISEHIDRAVIIHNGAITANITKAEIETSGKSLTEILAEATEYNSKRKIV